MKIINSLRIFENVGTNVLKEAKFNLKIYNHNSQNFEEKKRSNHKMANSLSVFS
jgi:hypothetical protein